MRRACRVTVKFATQKKRKQINALLESYRGAVNFFLRSLWETPGKLDSKTLNRLSGTRLSERYKSAALKQALEIVVFTKRSAKATKKQCSCPVFTGSAILDAKFVSIEDGKGSFDLVLRLSSLNKGHKIVIPTKRTRVLNKWLSKSGATLIQGCALSEDTLILWVAIPDQSLRVAESGEVIGIDIGLNKLIADSNGKVYGTGIKALCQKVQRKKRGSKAMQRARKERDQYVDRVVNQLPWSKLSVIAFEDLRGLKYGKKPTRGKKFRKAMAPLVCRRVTRRVTEKAEENRVLPLAVNPAYTSRTCPVPTCRVESKENRKGETFHCIHCGYTADADYVGGTNIRGLALETLRSVEPLGPKRRMT